MAARTPAHAWVCILLASMAGGCSMLRPDPARNYLYPPSYGGNFGEGSNDNRVWDRVTQPAGSGQPQNAITPVGGAEPDPPPGDASNRPMPEQTPGAPNQTLPASPPVTPLPYPLPLVPGGTAGAVQGSLPPTAGSPGAAAQPFTPGYGPGAAPGYAPVAAPGYGPGAAPGYASGVAPVYGPGLPIGDPHVRITPTVVGGRLQLSPWEIPADRVVDLTRRLDSLAVYNQVLEARIRELEARSVSREQSLSEAVRDLEATEAELGRLKSAAKAAQDEAAAYRARFQAMEKEDIETLRKVIAALEIPFPPVPRREP